MIITPFVGVDGGALRFQVGGVPAVNVGIFQMLANTIGTPFGGWFGKPVYGAVVNAGKKVEANGEVADPVRNCGCTTPASDGGTGAGSTAGPTKGPVGTTPIGGGVGGGKVGTPTGLPIGGGGMIGVKAGKNASDVVFSKVKASNIVSVPAAVVTVTGTTSSRVTSGVLQVI
jgi:hypothetical protein